MVSQMNLFEQFITYSEKMEEVAEEMDRADPHTTEYKSSRAKVEELQRRLPRGCMSNAFIPRSCLSPIASTNPLGNGLTCYFLVFDITEEIRKLREIKDIEDELQMIDDVLVKQTKAISDFTIALAYNDAPISKALRTLRKDRNIIHQYKGDAKHEYSEVLSPTIAGFEAVANLDGQLTVLLDLKQKQANISEARSSRLQAEQANLQANETARQGTIIVLVSATLASWPFVLT